MSRNTAPSSFRADLRPVASNDFVARDLERRLSRTASDFEEALLCGETVVLKESPDLNTLGNINRHTSPRRLAAKSSQLAQKEATFGQCVNNDYTPSTSARSKDHSGAPQIALTRSCSSSGSSTSSNEHHFREQDADVRTKRRSLLRSTGTASSPDLATLVRKAKERVVGGQVDLQNRQRRVAGGTNTPIESSNIMSNLNAQVNMSPRTRQRSTTMNGARSSDVSTPTSNAPKAKLLKTQRSMGETSSSIGSGRLVSAAGALASKGKASVRAKTSAFLGKFIGPTAFSMPSTPIETSYSSSSFYEDAPPVPPIPVQHRSPRSPIDVRNGQDLDTRPPNARAFSQVEIHNDVNGGTEDYGFILDRRVSSLRSSPERTIKGKAPQTTIKAQKRRSMSVSEADLKKVMTSGMSDRGRPSIQKDRDSVSEYSGMVKDLKREISLQLDAISATSIDVKNPSTPKSAKLEVDNTFSSSPAHSQEAEQRVDARIILPSSPVSKRPVLTLNTIPPAEESIVALSSNLKTPAKTPNTLSKMESNRMDASKHGLHCQRSRGTSYSATACRDTARLQVQHRSTASSSEPSLIPVSDEVTVQHSKRTVRLVPSSTSMGWPEATSPALSLCLSSQTDLTGDDTGNSRFTSSSTSREDQIDSDAKGRELATRCWTEDENFLPREKIAEWLGGTGSVNKIALRYYMDFFDFSGLRLDVAFRRLCAKLFLKAETQQVDRILEEFSRRYWNLNPLTMYGDAGVVHAVSYSLLLLNTDLHVAELAQRMSRTQFVRNTMDAIHEQMKSSSIAGSSTPELTRDDGSSFGALGSDGSDVVLGAARSRSHRSGSITSWNSISRELTTLAGGPISGASQSHPNGSSMSVHDGRSKTPRFFNRSFDGDLESLLKEMYTSIKSQQILQPVGHQLSERRSTSSLGSGNQHMRNGSRRGQSDRVTNLKRGSMRGIQSLFTVHASVKSHGVSESLDGRSSPAPSFANSTLDGVNCYSASVNQFLPPTIGFASNLSHTIIREAQEDDKSICSSNTEDSSISITDEELSLFGPPWAKEGMLCRKQYWESAGKRARTRNWMDVFVVIQKGELNMFTFSGEGSGQATAAVGGGNWLSNAQPVGTIALAHSLAHALPPPGYSRRPHCFVLTVSNGGVYFFQAGTEELVNEWVSTCNYWAARQSKEPLAGGVSNMEYGWNRINESDNRPSEDLTSLKDSDSISMRSVRSWHKRDPFAFRSSAAPFSDRVTIYDWKPPMPSTVPSTHDEENQLEALQKHVGSLKAELDQHNALRMSMQQMYVPRSANAGKALANWEKKSQYLLTEIVKYDSYIDSLKSAIKLRLRKRGEKVLEKALVVSAADDDGISSKRCKGHPDGETAPEELRPSLKVTGINETSQCRN